MKKLILMILGVLITFPMMARDFEYTYQGQTLTYTVISEDDKTCMTKKGNYFVPGNRVDGDLVIPAVAVDGNNEYAVVSIGADFFSSNKLTSVEIPGSVETIDWAAFARCGRLTSVEIPGSVEYIWDYAFSDCSELTSVYYNTLKPIEAPNNVFLGVYDKATLYVPAEAVEKCKLIDPWKNFHSIEAYKFNGIDDVSADIDVDHPCEVYTISGVKVADSLDGLATGIYIVRQGNAVKKMAVN